MQVLSSSIIKEISRRDDPQKNRLDEGLRYVDRYSVVSHQERILEDSERFRTERNPYPHLSHVEICRKFNVLSRMLCTNKMNLSQLYNYLCERPQDEDVDLLYDETVNGKAKQITFHLRMNITERFFSLACYVYHTYERGNTVSNVVFASLIATYDVWIIMTQDTGMTRYDRRMFDIWNNYGPERRFQIYDVLEDKIVEMLSFRRQMGDIDITFFRKAMLKFKMIANDLCQSIISSWLDVIGREYEDHTKMRLSRDGRPIQNLWEWEREGFRLREDLDYEGNLLLVQNAIDKDDWLSEDLCQNVPLYFVGRHPSRQLLPRLSIRFYCRTETFLFVRSNPVLSFEFFTCNYEAVEISTVGEFLFDPSKHLMDRNVRLRADFAPDGHFNVDIDTPIENVRDEDFDDSPSYDENTTDAEMYSDFDEVMESIYCRVFVGRETTRVDLRDMLLPSCYYVPKNVDSFCLISPSYAITPDSAVHLIPSLRGHEEAIRIAYRERRALPNVNDMEE